MEWKVVFIGMENTGYQISYSGLIINKCGKILTPYQMDNGYFTIKISHKGLRYSFLIHRLVALNFIPNPNCLPEVNHKDGNKSNNTASNLEWVSKAENMKHASLNGLLHPRTGSSSPFAKHEEDQIKKACEMLQNKNFSIQEVANLTGVSYKTLDGILHSGKWKHVAFQYDFNDRLNSRRKWDDMENKRIKELHMNGLTCKEIANKMNLPWNTSSKNHLYKYIRKCETSTTRSL